MVEVCVFWAEEEVFQHWVAEGGRFVGGSHVCLVDGRVVQLGNWFGSIER